MIDRRTLLFLLMGPLVVQAACDPSRFERETSESENQQTGSDARIPDAGMDAGSVDAGAARRRSPGGDAGGARGDARANAGAGGTPAGRTDAGSSADDDLDASDAGDSERVPDGVPSGAVLWLRADVDVALGQNGSVLTWSDHSGQKRDAYASSASAPKPVTVESRAWLEFSGAQELELPKMPALPQISMFVVLVARDDGGPNCPSFLHLSNRQSGIVQANVLDFGRHMQKLFYQSGTAYSYADASNPNTFTVNAPHLVGVVQGEDRIARLRLDSNVVAESEMPLPGAVERENNIIGDNRFYSDSNTKQCDHFVGLIGEILVYPRALDAAEISSLERYLSTKWELTP